VSSCSPTGVCTRCRIPSRARPWACWPTGTTARSSPVTIDGSSTADVWPVGPARLAGCRIGVQPLGPAGGPIMSRTTRHPLRGRAPPCLLALGSGWGSGRYPVTGRVTYEDGTPVEGGTVIAEATVNGKPVGVQANIENDGSFRLGGNTAGDGA